MTRYRDKSTVLKNHADISPMTYPIKAEPMKITKKSIIAIKKSAAPIERPTNFAVVLNRVIAIASLITLMGTKNKIKKKISKMKNIY